MLNVSKFNAVCVKRCMMMEIEGTRQTGYPKKTWWDFVKKDNNARFWK